MRRLLLASLLTCACAGVDETKPLSRVSNFEGDATIADGLKGPLWLFLKPPGAEPQVPEFVTAISAERLSAGHRHFRFVDVRPNAYRLTALHDTNHNFDPEVDVLAQAGVNDRIGEVSSVQVQPGRTAPVTVEVIKRVETEPPGFRLEGDETDLALDAEPNVPTPITIVADSIKGRLDPKRVAFRVGLVDANKDGRPDDFNGDGLPELTLQLLLRLMPKPGQVREGASIVVPVVLNPAPFTAALGNDVTLELAVDRLQGFILNQAQEVSIGADGEQSITPLGSAPAGNYELVLLAADGRFWRIPNDLGPVEPTQRVRFHFDRSSR